VPGSASSTIVALLAEMSQKARATPRPSATVPAGIAVSDAPPAMLDAITRLCGLIDEPEAADVLTPGVEREILCRSPTAPQAATVLWVPKISSTSSDQAIFVDQATDARLSSDAVVLEVARFG
jgi:hypothetical protein